MGHIHIHALNAGNRRFCFIQFTLCMHAYQDSTVDVTAIAWKLDGTKLAVAVDNSIKIMNVANNQVLVTLQGHTEEILTLAWRPGASNELLSSGGYDTTVHRWNTISGCSHLST